MDAVHESPSAHRWRKLWPLLRIAISVAGDLVLIKATFDHALRLDTFFSWTLAVGVTLVSVSLAWNGGIHLRKLVSDDTGRLRVGLLLGLSLVAWAVMGTGLFVLRYQEASSTTMAGNTTNGFAVSGPASSADQGRLLAWLLLAVFIGSGVLALIEGFATNSRAAQLRRLNPYLLGLAEQVAVTQGLLARLVANKAVHEHELRIVEQQRAEAEVATRALARELKALARVHIAQVLGNPSDSEVVHQVDPCGHSSRGSGDVTTAGASR